MRLGTKVLVLTMAVTLGLSSIIIWVITTDATTYEGERAYATIDYVIRDYFDRIDSLGNRIQSVVRMVMEDAHYRAEIGRLEFAAAESREFAVAQLSEEVFGRILQTELKEDDIAPAFHVLLNEDGDVLLATADSDPSLSQQLASGSMDWKTATVVEEDLRVRQYVWLADRLYLAFGIPLRTEMREPPTHAYFVGFEVDERWNERLLRLGTTDGLARLHSWFLVDGRVVSGSMPTAAKDRTHGSQAAALLSATPAPADPGEPYPISFLAANERFVGKAIAFRPARDVTGAFAVVGSLDEALARLRQLQRTIAIVTALVIAVAIVACRRLANMIAAPVEELVAGTERIARNDFENPIPVTRRDELGRLAKSFNDMAAGLKQRDFIKDTFGKFVDPKIVQDFMADPSRLHLGGERRTQSILFCDLADFTGLAERLSPEDLVALLNEYLGGAADTVTELRGIVDKFIGDAVVAFWGSPFTGEHAALSCRASLGLVELTRRMKDRCESLGAPPLRIRVGIATGEVLVGNIGSRNKYNYTVMGDAVNLASRLEGVNKIYNTQILVTARTAQEAGDAVISRRIDTVRVVGRSEPVEIVEVLASADDPSHCPGHLQARYAKALTLYEARDWASAREAFEACARESEADGPSEVMARRCTEFIASPPDQYWDGVWNLATK